jgi:polyisoprenoid-binding protein YceI
MRRNIVFLLATLALSRGETPAPRNAKLLSGSLSFDGRATTGSFTGTTTEVSAALILGSDLRTSRGWVEFAAASLRTNNDHRDRDMRQSLEADRYPTIRLDIDSVEVPGSIEHSSGRDSSAAFVRGRFTVRGVTREVRLPVTIADHSDTLHVRSDFDLDLQDYHIGGLTKMFGLLKMQPIIKVHAQLMFLLTEAVSLRSNP